MWDFGRAELLEPEAIGEPGHRTFRLRILSGGEAASLWLEKEQLAALTLGIRQLLEQTASEEPSVESDSPQPVDAFPEQPEVDFHVGRLGIGYDETKRLLVIAAHAPDEAEDAPPTFTCQASRRQCRALVERAEEVISAGRPLCLLCSLPVEGDSHQCLRRNGHEKHPVSLE